MTDPRYADWTERQLETLETILINRENELYDSPGFDCRNPPREFGEIFDQRCPVTAALIDIHMGGRMA